MKKSSSKLYFATLICSLILTSFAYAGNGQCPDVPPPPAVPQGRMSSTVGPIDSSQLLKAVWEFILLHPRLF